MFHFFIIKHHNYFIIIIISYYILFNFITFYWILLWIMCFYYMIMITLWCVYGVNYEIETSGCSHQFETRDLTLALAKSLTYLCVVVTIICICMHTARVNACVWTATNLFNWRACMRACELQLTYAYGARACVRVNCN